MQSGLFLLHAVIVVVSRLDRATDQQTSLAVCVTLVHSITMEYESGHTVLLVCFYGGLYVNSTIILYWTIVLLLLMK